MIVRTGCCKLVAQQYILSGLHPQLPYCKLNHYAEKAYCLILMGLNFPSRTANPCKNIFTADASRNTFACLHRVQDKLKQILFRQDITTWKMIL